MPRKIVELGECVLCRKTLAANNGDKCTAADPAWYGDGDNTKSILLLVENSRGNFAYVGCENNDAAERTRRRRIP